MDELMIKVENVTKEYRLGAIGGTTLRDELQRRRAKRKRLEDPTLKIGQTRADSNERFMALNGVSFEVKKGEAVGIIGHNGAGKSTLLKLITRITAPTTGDIYLNGRVASMLEVGTGFHGELTGRENVYLNGAILGMTKKEIDAKMDDIIAFSEIGQFIDTPVKRYSSGMYVKLAFSVAAHLDSEIMIMDEVLAVGDMAFQTKCLKRMREAAKEEGRTVLYVSHNMNTIRQLCDRCVVMDHGQVVFDGNVEEAIGIYLGMDNSYHNRIDVTNQMRDDHLQNPMVAIEQLFVDSDDGIFTVGDTLQTTLHLVNRTTDSADVFVRAILKTADGMPITMLPTEEALHFAPGQEINKTYTLNISNIVPGSYAVTWVVYEIGAYGTDKNVDVLRDIYKLKIKSFVGFNHDMPWNARWWGSLYNGCLYEAEEK